MSSPENPRPREPLLPTPFGTDVNLKGETLVIEVTGELCLATAPLLLARLDELEGGFDRLIVDLRRVTFVDSTGIRMLLQLESRSQADRFAFAISVDGVSARTLRLVGLTDRPARISGEALEQILAA